MGNFFLEIIFRLMFQLAWALGTVVGTVLGLLLKELIRLVIWAWGKLTSPSTTLDPAHPRADAGMPPRPAPGWSDADRLSPAELQRRLVELREEASVLRAKASQDAEEIAFLRVQVESKPKLLELKRAIAKELHPDATRNRPKMVSREEMFKVMWPLVMGATEEDKGK